MNINPNPPFLSEDEEHKGYRAIARLALFWGPIELQIEGFVALLRHRQQEPEPEPRVFPVSFSRKVNELKDRIKLEDELAEIREIVRPLIGRAKELHVMRAHIVHSYFQGQNLEGQLMFGRSDQKRGVAYTEAKYEISEIEEATSEMVKIHDGLAELWAPIQRHCLKPSAR